MAIYGKARTANDLINGLAVVCTGQKTQTYDNTDRTQHFASGDALVLYTTLNGRFKIDPSGWSA